MPKPIAHFAVYSIAWSPRGPAKVGITDRLVHRLDDLQTGCPFRLKIYAAWLASSEGLALDTEQKILKDLAPFRLLGEWLKLPPNLLAKHIAFTLKSLDPYAKPWKPTPEQRSARIINLAAFEKRLLKARAKIAIQDAKFLDIAIKN